MKKITMFALALAMPVLVSSCAHATKSEFGHYSKAERYYAQGHFDKAINEYAEYLKQEPEGNMAIIALYYTAKSQAALGNTEEAKAGYRNIIQKYPKSDWARFSNARLEELEAQ